MTQPATFDAIIIGAGVSGLTTAYRLMKQGWQVQVIEAADQPGGSVSSHRDQGFLWESGPNSALNTTPLVNQLINDLGIGDQYLNASHTASKRYIVRNGQLVALPHSPMSMLRTRAFSLNARLALLRELFVPPGDINHEESVSQFVSRRLGNEFLNYAIEPFVAGIYAGDPDALSLQAAFSRLSAAEQRYGSLIRAQIFGVYERYKRKEVPKDRARSFSFHNGMQTLTDALAHALPSVQLTTPVTAIERASDGLFTVTAGQDNSYTCRARTVVLATPSQQTATLVRPFSQDAATALEEIPYAPVAVLITACQLTDLSHPLDGFGFLVPRVEKRNILGTLFSSSMFSQRAPDGYAVMTTFIGGLRQPALATTTEDELLQMVQQEHSQLLGSRQSPCWQQLVRQPRAIPQYTLGHLDRLRRADTVRETMPNLFYCANWRGGVSMADCIKSAHATAEQIDAVLRQVNTQ